MSWPLKTLDEIFEIARGGSPRPIDQFITDADDGVNWIMIGDASNSSKHIRQTKKKIKPSGVSRSRLVKPGDFLLTNSMSFGRPYILDTHGCIHDGWLVLSPRRADVDHDYFYHLLGSPAIFGQFEKLAAGATVKNLNIDLVKSVVVPLPPLEEQKRIAAILDQADALRRKRQRAFDRLNQLGQAIFIEMFGDVSQLPRTHTFEEVATIQQSLVDPKLPQYQGALHVGPEHMASGAGIVNWEAVRTAQEDSVISGKNRFERGDVLFSKIRPYLNKVALADRSGICSADMYVIQPVERASTAHFLKVLLMGGDFLAYAETCSNRANIPKLNRKQVEGYRFYCPPIDAQREFADRLNYLDVMGSSYAKAAEASSTLYVSLQHQAFRGELTAASLKEVAA